MLGVAGCHSKSPPEPPRDLSGLSQSELAAPLPPSYELSREQIETKMKGADYYVAELSKKPRLGKTEWQRRIDSLHSGMFVSQVTKILPRNSGSSSSLWGYDKIKSTDLRQTEIWALDSEFAVAVETDQGGVFLWMSEGNPSPRLQRHENRIIGRPMLLKHSNKFSDEGILDWNGCQLR